MGTMVWVSFQFEDPAVKYFIGAAMVIGCVLPLRLFLKDVAYTRNPICVISNDGIRIDGVCLLKWSHLQEIRILKMGGDSYLAFRLKDEVDEIEGKSVEELFSNYVYSFSKRYPIHLPLDGLVPDANIIMERLTQNHNALVNGIPKEFQIGE